MAATIHPSAIVDDGALLGEGTRVWHFCHVCAGARIGARCSLGQNVYVGNDVVIGDNCKIQNNVSVYDGVRLEDDVFCGPSMVFTNVYNPRSAVVRKSEYRPTLVKRGASLLLTNRSGKTAADLARGALASWLRDETKKALDQLLASGAKSPATPRLLAQYGRLDALKLATEKGADVKAADEGGLTPLWAAADAGHEEVVAWLLAQRVDVNAVD